MQHPRRQNSNAQCCSRILFQSLHQQHKRIVSFNLQIELWSECYYPTLTMMRLGLWKFNNMPKSGKGWGPEFQLRLADLQDCPLKDCTVTSPDVERKRRRPYTRTAPSLQQGLARQLLGEVRNPLPHCCTLTHPVFLPVPILRPALIRTSSYCVQGHWHQWRFVLS